MCFLHDLLAWGLAVGLAVGLTVGVVVEFSAAIRFLATRIWLPSDYAVFLGNQILILGNQILIFDNQILVAGRVGRPDQKPDQTVCLAPLMNETDVD